jgi:hypothetical protein
VIEREGKVWPNIVGGALGTASAVEVNGRPDSEGGNTIRDAWGEATRGKVLYFTPQNEEKS